MLTLIEACLEKQAKDRPSPSQIIEFCVTRAAGTPESGQPWLEWGQVSAATGSADVATAQRRLRVPVGLAVAAALAAVAVIAVALTSHLASASNAAPGKVPAPSTPAARQSARPAPRSAVAAAPPSATRAATLVTSPAASRPSALSAATSPSPAVSATQEKPVVLLSQGRSVFASSIQGDPWAAANAVDGNLTTRWSSAFSDPQWLEVDLGAVYDIHSVVLYWEHAYATAFQIQVSDNGSTWTDLYPTISGYEGKQTLAVSGSGRYVRMYGTKRSTSYGYSLYEFQVFGN